MFGSCSILSRALHRAPGLTPNYPSQKIPGSFPHHQHFGEWGAKEREQVVDRLLRRNYERRAARVERERFGDALGARNDGVGVKDRHVPREGVFGAGGAGAQEEDPGVHPGVRSRAASMSRAAPPAPKTPSRGT